MSIYCVYLTIYRGNKLPPFYIGSTSLDKIKSGYRGSVSSKEYKSIWLEEIRTSPNLFETKILKTFSNRKDAYFSEERLCKFFNVKLNPLFVNKTNVDRRGNNYNTDENSYKRMAAKGFETKEKNLIKNALIKLNLENELELKRLIFERICLCFPKHQIANELNISQSYIDKNFSKFSKNAAYIELSKNVNWKISKELFSDRIEAINNYYRPLKFNLNNHRKAWCTISGIYMGLVSLQDPRWQRKEITESKAKTLKIENVNRKDFFWNNGTIEVRSRNNLPPPWTKGKLSLEDNSEKDIPWKTWNNGILEVRAKATMETPWVRGYCPERASVNAQSAKRGADKNKRRKWYTNGSIAIFIDPLEGIPINFRPGRK